MIARKKRQLIMIISIVLPIIIVIGVLVALYFTTDMFKPKYKLFEKYLAQNINTIDRMAKSKPEGIENAINNQKITENLKATVSYKDSNNNMSNTINKAEIDISGQKSKAENYNYQDARIVYENSDIARFEYLQDGEKHGIRLDGIQQFISAKNENLEELEATTEISKEKLAIIPIMYNQLKLSDFINFTSDETQVLSSTYTSILEQNTDKSSYEKKSNQNIVVNGNTYKANAYSLKQSKEKFNSLIITLLDRIEKDEIILGKLDTLQTELETYGSYKEEKNLREIFTNLIDEKIDDIKNNNIGEEETEITVYEHNGQTIKTLIKTPTETLTFDTMNTELFQVSYVQQLDNGTLEDNIKVEKKVSENNQDINIQYTNSKDGTEEKKFEVQIVQNKDNDKIDNNYKVTYTVDGNVAEVKIDQSINCVQEFENQIKLSDANNVDLNSLNQEQAKKIAEIAQNNVNNMISNVLENVKLDDINSMLKDLLILKESEIKFEQAQEEVVTEAERNRFNSQLTFFIGKEVDVTNINQLLDTIQDCFADAQVFYEEKSNNEKKLRGMVLDIKRKSSNEEKTDELRKVLDENKNTKFTIAMSFDENTKLINKITIVSNEFLK